MRARDRVRGLSDPVHESGHAYGVEDVQMLGGDAHVSAPARRGGLFGGRPYGVDDHVGEAAVVCRLREGEVIVPRISRAEG